MKGTPGESRDKPTPESLLDSIMRLRERFGVTWREIIENAKKQTKSFNSTCSEEEGKMSTVTLNPRPIRVSPLIKVILKTIISLVN